jgi:hypothetical protein
MLVVQELLVVLRGREHVLLEELGIHNLEWQGHQY